MTALVAGLVFGLAGSGHCAAMCGPLAVLAAPRTAERDAGQGDSGGAHRAALHAVLYHCGRASTYLVLGVLAALIGGSVARAGFGRVLAVVAGLALVAQALVAARLVAAPVDGPGRSITVILVRVSNWLRAHGVAGPLVFGVLNGLLPCGLLYAALVAAAGLADLRDSLIFVAAFAVGTTPALVVVTMASRALFGRVPTGIRRAAPVALALVGVLLIVRGVQQPHAAAHGAHAGHEQQGER